MQLYEYVEKIIQGTRFQVNCLTNIGQYFLPMFAQFTNSLQTLLKRLICAFLFVCERYCNFKLLRKKRLSRSY